MGDFMSEVALFGDTTMYRMMCRIFQALFLGESVYMQYTNCFSNQEIGVNIGLCDQILGPVETIQKTSVSD